MPNKTHVAIILDRSGSMSSTKKQTIEGYNAQIREIKENAKNGEILVSLITFNGEVYEHLWNESADKLQESTIESYCPNGATSMRDAIGYTIDKLCSTTTADDNTAYLIVTISDGDENSSKHFDAKTLKDRIDECQATDKWTFTFMGCDQSVLNKVAADTGIAASNMAMWDNSTSEKAMEGMYRNTIALKSYLSDRSKGEVKCKNLYSCDDQAANYAANLSASEAQDFAVYTAQVQNSTAQHTNKAQTFSAGGAVDWQNVNVTKNSANS